MMPAAAAVLATTAALLLAAPMPEAERRVLLQAREQVWRALFDADEKQLAWMLPEGSMAFGPGAEWAEKFSDRARIVAEQRDFVKRGGKLRALKFIRTEVQPIAPSVAILYTEFEWELESGNGNRTRSHGFATEIFHKHKGKWTNPGWHLEITPPGK